MATNYLGQIDPGATYTVPGLAPGGATVPLTMQDAFIPTYQSAPTSAAPTQSVASGQTPQAPFSFPQFNMPGFPFTSLPDQLAQSFVPPNQQFTSGAQYGRWNGVNNNGFGLFPDQFQSLFGSPSPPPMQFQPPYGNNGTLGSNQGPGSNPGGTGQVAVDPTMGGNDAAQMGAQQPFSGSQGASLNGAFNALSGAMNGAPNNKMAVAGSPPVPQGAYANQYAQGIMNDPALMHAMANGRMSGIASQLAAMPQSFTPQQVSQAMQNNPAAAFQMLQAGGGNLQNAVMQNNGMNQQQMNQFINNTGYNTPGAFSGLLNTMRGG